MSTTGVLFLERERVEDGSFIPQSPSVNSSVLSLCFLLRLPSPLGPFLLLPAPLSSSSSVDPSWAFPSLVHAYHLFLLFLLLT